MMSLPRHGRLAPAPRHATVPDLDTPGGQLCTRQSSIDIDHIPLRHSARCRIGAGAERRGMGRAHAQDPFHHAVLQHDVEGAFPDLLGPAAAHRFDPELAVGIDAADDHGQLVLVRCHGRDGPRGLPGNGNRDVAMAVLAGSDPGRLQPRRHERIHLTLDPGGCVGDQ